MTDEDSLKLAREAYSASSTYFDTSIRTQIESDMRQFQGLHPAGSKYYGDAYKSRSRLFRPKTRSSIRKNEAVAAEAFFSTVDVVNVVAEDDADELSQLAANVMHPIMQHRLKKSIPWFMTCIGAYQEAQAIGVVTSYQYWEYDAAKGIDKPCCDLIPVENLRIDPAAKWTDPINSSPYVIQLLPMYVRDVEAKMNATPDPKIAQKKWITYSRSEIQAATKTNGDSTRLLREGQRTDSTEQSNAITEFTIVWVHRNIINVDGEDMLFYTLGTERLLSKPVPLKDVYAHGKRPYVMGICAIEAHKIYPSGVSRLTKDTQQEINDIANQRIDNVKFAMNKRYFVSRNKQVDLRSLTRSIPGSITLMSDIEKDVRVIDTPDVTSSSYQEQDRLNLDFDDVSGSFSQSSVSSNRKLNETVGGMNMLTTNANQISAYQLRTFVETWVEPVLEQLIDLERSYETDEKIIGLSPEGREVLKQQVNLEALFAVDIGLQINVGMGATNPHDQIQNFMSGMTSLSQVLENGVLQQQGLQVEEVIKEIFGKLGYSNGARFFKQTGEDPQTVQLKQQVQTLQQQVDAKNPPELIAAQVKKLQAEAESLAARTTETNVKSQYSAMQAAEVIAAVPGTAPIADEVLKSSGYAPSPTGVDPNLPQPAQADSGLAVQAVNDKHTGVGFMPGESTNPLTPAALPQPESPAIGAQQGIETQRPDGA